jgi:hypothetical protein
MKTFRSFLIELLGSRDNCVMINSMFYVIKKKKLLCEPHITVHIGFSRFYLAIKHTLLNLSCERGFYNIFFLEYLTRTVSID